MIITMGGDDESIYYIHAKCNMYIIVAYIFIELTTVISIVHLTMFCITIITSIIIYAPLL